jgi:hypothetical protein
MMVHIAMDDMAIVGKGALAQPVETELSEENLLREIDAMLESVRGFEAQTKIVDREFRGSGLSSAVCQKISYDLAGTEVSLVFGLEKPLLRYATEYFWGDKTRQKVIDRAHMVLLQWCLTAFSVSLWRELIVRFAHDKSCLLREMTPLNMKGACQLVRTVNPRRSVLFETAKGRFFVICDH